MEKERDDRVVLQEMSARENKVVKSNICVSFHVCADTQTNKLCQCDIVNKQRLWSHFCICKHTHFVT